MQVNACGVAPIEAAVMFYGEVSVKVSKLYMNLTSKLYVFSFGAAAGAPWHEHGRGQCKVGRPCMIPTSQLSILSS